MSTDWNVVLSTDTTCVNALVAFANGQLNCEQVQVPFRNRYTEASGQLRKLIRTRGAAEARRLARTALRRRQVLS